jgi:DNA-binding NarL/FixJ family response regulator
MDDRTRILLVDDHPVVRDGLREMLEKKGDMLVCAEAENQQNALSAIANHLPDLAIVDISLKNGENGLDLVKALKQRYPELRCLVLSMFDEEIYAERALRAGAWGYLMKSESGQKIIEAIQRIMQGEVYVSAKVQSLVMRSMIGAAQSGAPDLNPEKVLSDRELQVFPHAWRRVCRGRDFTGARHCSFHC